MKYKTVEEWDSLSYEEQANYLLTLPKPNCPFCNKQLVESKFNVDEYGDEEEKDYIEECEGCPYKYQEISHTLTHYYFTVGGYTVTSQKAPICEGYATYNTIIFSKGKILFQLEPVYTIDHWIDSNSKIIIQKIETLITFI